MNSSAAAAASVPPRTRKIFNADNLTESKIVKRALTSLNDNKHQAAEFKNPIAAAGSLFYYKSSNKDADEQEPLLLLNAYEDPEWPKLDDFGGRVSMLDVTLYDTIRRKVALETNNQIEFTRQHYETGVHKYNRASKYLCVLVKLSDEEYAKTKQIDFGDVMLADEYRRTIKWYPLSKVLPTGLANARLTTMLNKSDF